MGSRLRLPLLLFALTVPSLLLACGPVAGPPEPTLPPPTPTLAAGWRLYEKPTEGFALALPPNWQEIDLDPAALEAGLQALRERNPALAEYFRADAQSQLTAYGKFFALELSPDSGSDAFTPYVMVSKVPQQYELSADELLLDFLAEADSLPNVVSEPVSRHVALAAGDSVEVWYVAAVAVPGTRVGRLALFSYLLTKKQNAYVIGFAVAEAQLDDYAPLFEEIARSFRWLE